MHCFKYLFISWLCEIVYCFVHDPFVWWKQWLHCPSPSKPRLCSVINVCEAFRHLKYIYTFEYTGFFTKWILNTDSLEMNHIYKQWLFILSAEYPKDFHMQNYFMNHFTTTSTLYKVYKTINCLYIIWIILWTVYVSYLLTLLWL